MDMAATAPDMTYWRPPLQDATKQIRLLHIYQEQVNSQEQTINCSLVVHNLDDAAGQYVAISYTWGSEAAMRTITVNGFSIQVRWNCWYALLQMRFHNVSQYYWLDSLCIDQSFHAEKQEQIRQMSDIYSSADMVAACIGEHGAGIESLDDTSPLPVSNPFARMESWSQLCHDIAHRDYFHRLWAVQECLLARDIRIFCGERHYPWQSLATKFKVGRARASDYSSHRQQYEGLVDFFNDCPLFSPATSFRCDVAEAVLRYGSRNCYDARDKVYGILALVPDQVRRSIPIDYDKPLLQVLLDFASSCKELQLGSIDRRWTGQTMPTDPYRLFESIRLLSTAFASASLDFSSDLKWFLQTMENPALLSQGENIDTMSRTFRLLSNGALRISRSTGPSDTTSTMGRGQSTIVDVNSKADLDTALQRLQWQSPHVLDDSAAYHYARTQIGSVVAKYFDGLEDERGAKCLIHCFSQRKINLPEDDLWCGIFRVPLDTKDGDILMSRTSGRTDFVVCREETPGHALSFVGQAKHLSETNWQHIRDPDLLSYAMLSLADIMSLSLVEKVSATNPEALRRIFMEREYYLSTRVEPWTGEMNSWHLVPSA